MSNSWQEVYTKLRDFIAEHPEVKIEASSVRIPENVRLEFYQVFDAVRTAFVEEKFPGLLNEGRPLSESYLKAEEEVIKLLGLESIFALPPLHRFLHNPTDGLRRDLFDLMFDLLKGKVDNETFEEGASQNIKASFRLLNRLGYEKWVALSLVKLFESDKSFQVIVPELQDKELAMMEDPSGMEVPTPKESKCLLLFKHWVGEALMVPDFIVHSAKVDRYVALRSEIGRAIVPTTNASKKREWYSLDSMPTLETGLTLVYVADDPEEISLVADEKRICRPDLIIECREQKDWYETEGLEKIKSHHYSLKPTQGTYIVSKEAVPEQALAQLEDDIQIITVGFDASKLTPIIGAFIGGSGNDQ